MKNLIYIFFLVVISLSVTEIAFAESMIAKKLWGDKDCSQYSTKTLKGLSEYSRCKRGLEPEEKSFLNFKWLKDKKKEFDPNKPCEEYSTKTFTGLSAKMKCKRAKKK